MIFFSGISLKEFPKKGAKNPQDRKSPKEPIPAFSHCSKHHNPSPSIQMPQRNIKRPIKIKDRHSGRVLFETEAETLKDALEEAIMFGVNLWSADLRNADLGGACLAQAELSNADFSGANLFNATLWRAALTGARFCNVDLRYANVRYANLYKAVLRSSNLVGADFLQSNLTQADFRNSDVEGILLRGANLADTYLDPRPKAPEEGSFVGWKEVYDKRGNSVMAKLLVLEDAKRTTPLVGRTCRAEFVKVLELSPSVSAAREKFYPDRIYRVGEVTQPICYNDDVNVVCTEGIHFQLTREDAYRRWYPPLIPAAEYWKSATHREWVWAAKHLGREVL